MSAQGNHGERPKAQGKVRQYYPPVLPDEPQSLTKNSINQEPKDKQKSLEKVAAPVNKFPTVVKISDQTQIGRDNAKKIAQNINEDKVFRQAEHETDHILTVKKIRNPESAEHAEFQQISASQTPSNKDMVQRIQLKAPNSERVSGNELSEKNLPHISRNNDDVSAGHPHQAGSNDNTDREIEQLKEERVAMARIIEHKTVEIQKLKRELINQQQELRQNFEFQHFSAQYPSNSPSGTGEELFPELENKDAQILTLKEERQQLSDLLVHKNKELQLLKRKIIEMDMDFTDVELRFSRAMKEQQQQKEASKQNPPKNESEESQLQQENSSLLQVNRQLKEAVNGLEEKVKAHEKTNSVCRQELDNIKYMVESKATKKIVEELELEIKVKNHHIQSLKNNLQEQQKQIDSLNVTIADQITAITGLEREMQLVKQTVSSSSSKRIQRSPSENVEGEEDEAAKRLELLEEELVQKNRIIVVWIKQYEKVEQNRRKSLGKVQNRVRDLQRKVTELQANTQGYEDTIKGLRKEVEARSKLADQLREQKDEACSKYAKVIEQYMTVKSTEVEEAKQP